MFYLLLLLCEYLSQYTYFSCLLVYLPFNFKYETLQVKFWNDLRLNSNT